MKKQPIGEAYSLPQSDLLAAVKTEIPCACRGPLAHTSMGRNRASARSLSLMSSLGRSIGYDVIGQRQAHTEKISRKPVGHTCYLTDGRPPGMKYNCPTHFAILVGEDVKRNKQQ